MQGFVAALLLVAASAVPCAAQSFDERMSACFSCHGEAGRSETAEVPSLGAQPAPYVLIQLYMFRERLRVVEPMNDSVKGVSDDDLRRMADRIARLPPPPPAEGPADALRIERARTLMHANRCFFCHGANLAGQEGVPRLAGQREDYLLRTLREYKTNARPGYDASMADVVRPLTDEHMHDLAYFLARAQ